MASWNSQELQVIVFGLQRGESPADIAFMVDDDKRGMFDARFLTNVEICRVRRREHEIENQVV